MWKCVRGEEFTLFWNESSKLMIELCHGSVGWFRFRLATDPVSDRICWPWAKSESQRLNCHGLLDKVAAAESQPDPDIKEPEDAQTGHWTVKCTDTESGQIEIVNKQRQKTKLYLCEQGFAFCGDKEEALMVCGTEETTIPNADAHEQMQIAMPPK
eukprot:m.202479 g.202479  ORF g.202479 m.202479 type:complete len:156 (+) comp18439_c0_seq10:266-733(+)